MGPFSVCSLRRLQNGRENSPTILNADPDFDVRTTPVYQIYKLHTSNIYEQITHNL